MEYIIEKGEYKGHPTLAIWESQEGEKKGNYPIVSFGKKKYQAVLDNLEAVKEFVQQGAE